jgi:hypothetical protein
MTGVNEHDVNDFLAAAVLLLVSRFADFLTVQRDEKHAR